MGRWLAALHRVHGVQRRQALFGRETEGLRDESFESRVREDGPRSCVRSTMR